MWVEYPPIVTVPSASIPLKVTTTFGWAVDLCETIAAFTVPTRVHIDSHTYMVTNVEALDFWSNLCYLSNYLMSAQISYEINLPHTFRYISKY
jgi:hypothetical protein